MARARNIKPGFFKNEILGAADPLYMILFEGLWVLADREGRLENRPLRIKAEIFPYREGVNVAEMLNWLDGQGFITQYEVGGVKYIQVANFVKHQNPHKNETESEIPGPDKPKKRSEKIGKTPEKIGKPTETPRSTRADSLTTDSLNSDSLKAASGFALPPWIDPVLWKCFEEHRNKLKKSMTPRARELIVAELEKLSPDHADVAAILDQSIRNSWQDVFPLKDKAAKAGGGGAVSAWWASNEGIQAKAQELGITPPKGGSWADLKALISARIGQ